ncbi:MAG TPA: ABC transporter substrate-binding protein [Chloroflexota bacterium]|nr:ABC transporter substrate-binding protein [Chloroflexota bacterium]
MLLDVRARCAPVAVLSAFALTVAACAPSASPASPTVAPAAAAKPTTAAAAAKPAAAGTVSCAEFATPGSGGAPIKVGADGSLTGATANFGTGMKRGIDICAKEFNDAGGYQGRKVEITTLDDQVKPEIAVANITRFLEQDKVIAVLGPVNSGNALAFIPKTEEAEVPVIVPISTSVQVVYVDGQGQPAPVFGDPGVKPRKWVFRSSMQDNFQVETILGYAKSKGWDAIGLMHDTSGYGTASKATADKLIPAGGFKILATETYNIGDTDMTSQLQKMKAAGVKQIVNFGLGPEDANMLRSAQKIDYKAQFSGAWGWSDPLVPQLAGKDLAEGVITVASFTPDQSPAAADFHSKMLRDYNEDVFPVTAAQAYDATRMLLMALSKSGPDATKLRDAIENLDGFKGVTAAPSKPFSADRHHSLEGKDMFAAVWKNGELVKAQ